MRHEDLIEKSHDELIRDDVSPYDVPICVTCVKRCSVLSKLPFMPYSTNDVVTRASEGSLPRYQLTVTCEEDSHAENASVTKDAAFVASAKTEQESHEL